MSWWTRLGLALAIVGAATLAWTGLINPETSHGATSAVRLLEPSQNAQLNGTVQLQVRLEEVSALTAWEVKLGYDPNVLDFESFATTDFLASTGRQATCPGAVEDEKAGTVLIGCVTSQYETPVGVSGSAVVATVVFKATGAGDTAVEILKRELSNYLGEDCCGAPDTYEAAVRVYGNDEDEPDDLPATPTPNPQKLTPTAVPASALSSTPRAVFGTADAPSGGSGGVSGSGSTRSGSSQSGQAATSGANNDFPVAGYGPQDNRSGRPEQIATALVLAGAVMVLAGTRTDRRRGPIDR